MLINMDLISIVIPCYNVAPYLQKCIESIAKQSYKKLEVVFVNDGSTDDTLDILNKLTKSGGGKV